jgi:hypothetical protein
MADITGQSLPSLPMKHALYRTFHLVAQAPNRLGVNFDVVVLRAMLPLANAIDAVEKVGAR